VHLRALRWYTYQQANGVFDVARDIAIAAGFTVDDLAANESKTGKASIHLKICFGYGPASVKPEWLAAPVYYYYRAAGRRLVLDVGAAERRDLGVPL
jgi:hypothetical protein